MVDSRVRIGLSEEYLNTNKITTDAGPVHNEVVEVANLSKTAFGDLRVAELSPIFQVSFEFTVTNTEISDFYEYGLEVK